MIVLLYIKTEDNPWPSSLVSISFRHVVTNVQISLDHPRSASLCSVMASTEGLREEEQGEEERKNK
jgi:hypothetical protein